MPSPFHPGYNPLILKLESVFTLTDDERQALETLPMQVMAHQGPSGHRARGRSPHPVLSDPERLCLRLQDDSPGPAPDRLLHHCR